MREITDAEVLRGALCEEMRRDENIFVLGEDVDLRGEKGVLVRG